MENSIFELQYALDTFLLPGDRRAGYVDGGRLRNARGRSRPFQKHHGDSAQEHLLYAVACTMYAICGYMIMYGGDFLLSSITGDGVGGRGARYLRTFS